MVMNKILINIVNVIQNVNIIFLIQMHVNNVIDYAKKVMNKIHKNNVIVFLIVNINKVIIINVLNVIDNIMRIHILLNNNVNIKYKKINHVINVKKNVKMVTNKI